MIFCRQAMGLTRRQAKVSGQEFQAHQTTLFLFLIRRRKCVRRNARITKSRPRRLRFTQLDPAMLIHRVEPIYPPLAKQTHREGRVELRAIIGTDGRIRSLQIVAGDPLFEQSAVEAVQQWRYKPTILNGQPVEIDTSIMVIYSMQR